MLEDFAYLQPVPYKILSNALKKNKISHAYLFEANDYPKTFDMAVAFAKALFCVDNNIENISAQIDSGNFEELKIINPDNLVIKKEQLEQLQQEFSKKAVIGNKKIYIINGAEYLNQSASNSILKFIEEPEENIIAILITNNIYNVLGTIVSRCQVIPFSKIKEQELTIYNNYKRQNVNIAISLLNSKDEIQKFLDLEENNVDKVIEFVKYYEKNHKNTLLFTKKLWHSYFTDKNTITFAFDVMILLYKDILNVKVNRKIEVFIDEEKLINGIKDVNTIEQLVKKLSILIDLKSKIGLNMNSNLLVDKLIIDFLGGN